MISPAWSPHLPLGTAPGDVDLAPAANLTARWRDRWAAEPGHVVLTGPGLHGDRQLTCEALEQVTGRVAAVLHARELRPGQRILLCAEPSLDLAVVYIAALRLGLVVMPVNPAYRQREFEHLVTDATPSAAVVDDGTRATWIAEAAHAPIATLDLAEVARPPAGTLPAPELDRAHLDDAALLVYTSGTTGAPKGAVLTHGNLLASAEALGLAWRWTPEDRLVLPLPLFHLHGLGVGLHGTLCAGAAAVIRPRFEAADTLDAIADHRATLLFGVPTIWGRLAASGRAEELAGLRLGVSGSAPLDPGLFAAIEAASGHRLIERYGMTETVMNVSNPHDGDRRPGTVGLPLPEVEVRLEAETNEISVRGPNVFEGYWHRPDATAEAFDNRWFATGDVGAFDEAGYLQIVGRSKELIISGGYNVYPREVGDVLRAHPAVEDAAVIGEPHPDWGEAVMAVLEGPGTDADTAAVLAWCRDRLAPYKTPKRVLWVEALPRNPMGKVVIDQVRSLLG